MFQQQFRSEKTLLSDSNNNEFLIINLVQQYLNIPKNLMTWNWQMKLLGFLPIFYLKIRFYFLKKKFHFF